MRSARLGGAFFRRDTVGVATELLGMVLARREAPGGAVRMARIIETEAYVSGDPANHATKGPTRRNWSMFTGPGHLYVYRIHQVHCANVTTAPGEAVLLRAAEPLTGGLKPMPGPGLLCRAMGIGKAEDGIDVTVSPEVWFVRGDRPPSAIVAGPRVGIRAWTDVPLRFREAPPVRRQP